MSSSNWDNDAYYDNDTWFQAVTYDQTDYRGLGPALERPAPASVAPADLAAGHDPRDRGGDPYAGYDEFGYAVGSLDSPPRADPWPQPQAESWQQPASESWQQPPAESWQQPASAPWKLPEADPWPQPDQSQPQPQPQSPPGEAWGPDPGPPDEPWLQQIPPDAPWAPGPGGAGNPWWSHAPRPSRWLIVGVSVVVAAALGFSVVMLAHRGNASLPASAPPSATVSPKSSPASPASPRPSAQPPVTRSQAQQVLAAYTATNNTANAQASQSLLATVEGGGSLAIDAGIYDGQRAGHSAPYPAFHPVTTSYYIPLESPAAYPHWFAVRVTNALNSSGKVINAEYLVFTQASAGASWLDSIEPFVLSSATLPSIALNASGFATAVSPGGTSLMLPAATAGTATATALDTGAGQPASPGDLADQEALMSLKKALPSHPSITSSHSATSDPVFGLRTTDGGALLFYDVAARITLTAAPGTQLHLDIPGFMSPAGPASQVTLEYLDQFAVTDPPAGGGTPARVIADYSGLTGSAG